MTSPVGQLTGLGGSSGAPSLRVVPPVARTVPQRAQASSPGRLTNPQTGQVKLPVALAACPAALSVSAAAGDAGWAAWPSFSEAVPPVVAAAGAAVGGAASPLAFSTAGALVEELVE